MFGLVHILIISVMALNNALMIPIRVKDKAFSERMMAHFQTQCLDSIEAGKIPDGNGAEEIGPYKGYDKVWLLETAFTLKLMHRLHLNVRMQGCQIDMAVKVSHEDRVVAYLKTDFDNWSESVLAAGRYQEVEPCNMNNSSPNVRILESRFERPNGQYIRGVLATDDELGFIFLMAVEIGHEKSSCPKEGSE